MRYITAILLGVLFLCSTSAKAQTLNPGSSVELKPNEGLALFDIRIDTDLKRIRLDRIGSIFSFPKIENLPVGTYSRLLKLPAGEYQFTRFETEWVYWEFDDVRNSRFKVEPGKINYVGEVNSNAIGWSFRSLAVENSAMRARSNLERDFPGLLAKLPWRYTGEFSDPFFDRHPNLKVEQSSPTEEIVSPKIEDRDAAEIFFRRFSTWASDLSPDGKYVLETVSEGKSVALNLLEIDSGKQRTIYSGPAPSRTQWVDKQFLALTIPMPGTTLSRLLKISSTSDVKELPLPTGVILGVVPNTGELLMTSKVRAWKVIQFLPGDGLDDSSVKKATLASGNSSKVFDWWIDGKGTLRLAQLYTKSKQGGTRWRYIDPATNEAVEFSLPEPKNYQLQIVGLDAKGGILALSNKESDFVELFELDPRTGKTGRQVAALKDADIESISWKTNHEVGGLYYMSNGAKVQKSLSADADEALASGIRKLLPNRNIDLAPSDRAGRRLVYVDGPEEPGSAYLYDSATKKLNLLSSFAPHLEGRPLASSERFVTRAKDGFEIESFLTRVSNEDGKKYPLIVLPHGGPFDVIDYKRFDPEVQYFAKLGFAVLQVNFRGSGGKGKTETARGAGEWGNLMIADINSAVDQAIKQFPIDDSKIAAMGTSYGGYGAVRLLQLDPKRYRAAVGICGVYDLPLLFHTGRYSRSKKTVDLFKKTLADPATELEELIAQSPAYGSEKLSSPILLVHDRGDDIAPFEHALRLQASLSASGNRVTLLPVNDLQHGLVVPATAIANYPKIAKFLREALSIK